VVADELVLGRAVLELVLEGILQLGADQLGLGSLDGGGDAGVCANSFPASKKKKKNKTSESRTVQSLDVRIRIRKRYITLNDVVLDKLLGLRAGGKLALEGVLNLVTKELVLGGLEGGGEIAVLDDVVLDEVILGGPRREALLQGVLDAVTLELGLGGLDRGSNRGVLNNVVVNELHDGGTRGEVGLELEAGGGMLSSSGCRTERYRITARMIETEREREIETGTT
jgi:hypothetical protein